MIEPLVLEDCEQAGCDHERRRGAGADLPSVDMSTESDLLGPTRAPLEPAGALPLARAVTSHWLGRLLKDLSGKGWGRDLLAGSRCP